LPYFYDVTFAVGGREDDDEGPVLDVRGLNVLNVLDGRVELVKFALKTDTTSILLGRSRLRREKNQKPEGKKRRRRGGGDLF
jgi:hypothetical protein